MQDRDTRAREDKQVGSSNAEFATFKARDVWMRAVLADSALSPAARNAGVRIALFLRVKTGRCDPTYQDIADALGCARSSAIRVVGELIERGWLAGTTSRGRHSNEFEMLWPDANGLSSETVQADANGLNSGTVENSNGLIPEAQRSQDRDRKRSHSCDRHNKRSEREAKKSGKSKSLRPAVRSKEEAREKNSHQDAFEAFWRTYPKRVARLAAEKAWAKAIKIATPEQIIEGARRYAAARAGEPPKYTRHPASWLNAGQWSDEADGGPVVDEDGNPIFPNQKPHSSGGNSLADFAQQVIREGILKWG